MSLSAIPTHGVISRGLIPIGVSDVLAAYPRVFGHLHVAWADVWPRGTAVRRATPIEARGTGVVIAGPGVTVLPGEPVVRPLPRLGGER